MRSYSLGGTCFDPLNIMCSKKWEMPVIPGASLRDPTRYHCQKVMVGTLWSSCVRTTRPFGSVWRSILNRSGVTASASPLAASSAATPAPGAAAAGGIASTRAATHATPSAVRAAPERTRGLIELILGLRRHLVRADAPDRDVRAEVVLAPHRSAREPAQHRELSGVGEGVGDRTLEELLRRIAERPIRSEQVVQGPELGEEAGHLGVPGKRLAILPTLDSLGEPAGPVEQVPDVSQDLGRGARCGPRLERRELRRRSPDRLPAPIGEGRQGVAQKLARGGHGGFGHGVGGRGSLGGGGARESRRRLSRRGCSRMTPART